MNRRAFIAALGGAGISPLIGQAQQPERTRRVGVLVPYRENDPFAQAIMTAFAHALERFGWIEGKNIRIDYRLAAGDSTLIKTYAAQLVDLSPDVILAITTPAVAALQGRTHTIPIVFVLLVDPVGLGFVQSLARPGGDITGFTSYEPPILAKWLQLLKEIAPDVTHVAVIFNPDTVPEAPWVNRAIEAAAPSLGITATLSPVHDDAGIEEAIAGQAREPGGGLITLPNVFNGAHRSVIIAAASRHSLPLIGTTEIVRDGGLMCYWFDAVELHAQAASYIDKILRGAKPADLPVQQPTKYSLIINLKTAKALGLTVPPAMLDLADEVIE